MTKSGLKPHHFSPRNLLPIVTCPFCNTVVSIVACSQIFKVCALFVPAIQRDCWSCDLGQFLLTEGWDLSPLLPFLWITRSQILKIYRRASLLINDYDWFLPSGFKSFNSQSSLPPSIILSRVHGLSTCVSHISTTVFHFRSLDFKSSKLLHLLPLKVVLSEVHDLLTRVFLDTTTVILFESLGFRSLKLLCTRSSRNDFTRRQWIFSTCLSIYDGLDSLRLFEVHDFQLLHTRSSRSSFTQRHKSVDTYPPNNQWPGFASGYHWFLSLLD
jgi:hypothetical protein